MPRSLLCAIGIFEWSNALVALDPRQNQPNSSRSSEGKGRSSIWMDDERGRSVLKAAQLRWAVQRVRWRAHLYTVSPANPCKPDGLPGHSLVAVLVAVTVSHSRNLHVVSGQNERCSAPTQGQNLQLFEKCMEPLILKNEESEPDSEASVCIFLNFFLFSTAGAFQRYSFRSGRFEKVFYSQAFQRKFSKRALWRGYFYPNLSNIWYFSTRALGRCFLCCAFHKIFLKAPALTRLSIDTTCGDDFSKRTLWRGSLYSQAFEKAFFKAGALKRLSEAEPFKKKFSRRALWTGFPQPGLSKGMFESDALKRLSIAKPFKTSFQSESFEKVIYSQAFPKRSFSKRALWKAYLRLSLSKKLFSKRALWNGHLSPGLSKSTFQSGRFEQVFHSQAFQRAFFKGGAFKSLYTAKPFKKHLSKRTPWKGHL